MLMYGYSVYDKKVEAYLPLFFARSRGEAIRSFSDACQDGSHNFCKHAEDYVLMEVCVFNDEDGTVRTPDTGPKPIGSALDFVKVVQA